MNAFDCFPKLMVLFAAILFLEPITSLLWPGVHEWSTVLHALEILVWLQWDARKGNEDAISRFWISRKNSFSCGVPD